ncbi:hypothetical protein [Antrihabitans stalagmiti]|nr:hypothetical protein [Antrihabitans stalagmiti]
MSDERDEHEQVCYGPMRLMLPLPIEAQQAEGPEQYDLEEQVAAE